jgi:hypothetical protein
MLALEQALAIAEAQETWSVNDDLCDCPNQRISYHFNPYHGVTEESRLCCIYARLREWWPDLFRTTVQEPAQWNGEADMPKSIWHRQLSNELGMPLSQVRDMGLEPPQGIKRTPRPTLFLKWSGEWLEMKLG